MDAKEREEQARARRAEGYIRLVNTYGAERVADALLAKWMSDEDATQKWEHLAQDMEGAPRRRRQFLPRLFNRKEK